MGWFFGFIGGLCMVMGILTALEVVPLVHDALTWMFWFIVSALLLLISIVFILGSKGGKDYE